MPDRFVLPLFVVLWSSGYVVGALAIDVADPLPLLALRFTLSQPGVHCAIIGTTNPDNAKRNIELAGRGSLPRDVVDRIRAAFKNADPEGKWTGQT